MRHNPRDRGSATAVVAIVLACIAIPFAVWAISVATAKPVGQGNAYRQKESANNRVFAQQYFEDTSQDIRSTQVKITRAAKDPDPSDQEKTILAGLQQYCSTLVGDYNAKSRSYTTQDFKAADLPATFDPLTDCEPTP